MNGNMQQLASAGQGSSQPNPAQQNLLNMQMAMNNLNGQQQSQIMGRQMGPNGMMNGGQPPMHPQHLQGRPPQQGGPPTAQPRRPIQRPSPDQLQNADKVIKELQQQWMISQRGGANFAYINVPEHQRTQYNEALGRLSTAVKDFEHKMPMYFAISQSLEQIKKLVIITLSTKFQEHQCSQNSNRYIVDLDTLRSMLSTIQNANNGFMQMVTAISVMEAQQRNAAGGGPPPQHGMHSLSPMPPHQQPPLPQRSPAPRPIPAQPTRKPSQTFPPGLTPVASSATPPHLAATPSAQAVTPSMAAASPQTPKSPKTKAAPKKTRRKATKAAAPSPEETSTAAATTPATPATPADVKVSAKRAREDEGPSAGEASTSAPSPKRVKADADGPLSDTQAQREKDAENAASGSDEDLIAFLENITQYTNTTNPEGSQAYVGSSELGDVLNELLKAYPSTDVEANGEGSSSSALGSLELDGPHPLSPPSSQLPEPDSFAEYYDLSSFDDVSVPKAPTPDLVQASSTNPSPESGSEADAAGHLTAMHHIGNAGSPHIAAVGLDDSEEDPLRLGIWKEIDGGEAAFYEASGWKWDAPMSTSEHPWAVSS
ncbi:uncharacterized protein STEHIDRAFT_152510 [Stereum hirsutum FP-91666 SS1]|uniref:uncharacterized protein n=1 Tax=Stereum hirsutum (strain FP-91666) TaxID=721885 RepID=UPI000440A67C|nr:uncharacterized protein STEHIDRAFT_152510 [Stereum hirsutum FP-91666 SS1]EIM90817.1 hypothetical protein STEHIDRAFT_152510 [Stereum hirsutum FP-91666 SS1]